MIAIVSQAWTRDAGESADAYLRGSEEFLAFLHQQPGFRGRMLLRGTDDPTHFTNVRFFDRAEDYDELIHRDGYAERINALGTYLDLETPPVKETVEVALADLDGLAP
jgi:heme-degrading monooxygenase HmoA